MLSGPLVGRRISVIDGKPRRPSRRRRGRYQIEKTRDRSEVELRFSLFAFCRDESGQIRSRDVDSTRGIMYAVNFEACFRLSSPDDTESSVPPPPPPIPENATPTCGDARLTVELLAMLSRGFWDES